MYSGNKFGKVLLKIPHTPSKIDKGVIVFFEN